MSKLIIVSNRLPVNITRDDKGELQFVQSVGGLATGLSSFHNEGDSVWIGWPGMSEFLNADEQITIFEELLRLKCRPVFIKKQLIDDYYYGFSNKTVWPLFHYFSTYADYKDTYWEAYKQVNQEFCNEILKVAEPGDKIWVQDYHLMLLPELLRKELPDSLIGFFLHIPFPSSEIFRQMPYRDEVLKGLLGADLLGFHTYDYVRHFHEAVRRIAGFEHEYGLIKTEDRTVKADAFPISIDYDKFHNCSDNKETSKEIKSLENEYEGTKVIVSIDRLDYSKGIPHRLEAFNRFLEKYPEYRGKVYMIMCAVPSRTQVDTYQDLKNKVDELVGRINGKYGTVEWTPIKYLFRFLTFPELSALYYYSDIAVVTPVRDGMNLVAKEYVASKKDGKGVLILSETAGAAHELTESLIVNPNDTEQIADTIKEALEMDEDSQRPRLEMMQERLKRYDIRRWASDFMESLDKEKERQKKEQSKKVTVSVSRTMISKFKKSKKRLFLLDYDGTLVDFAKKPEKAKPDKELIELINKLSADKRNSVALISGRNKDFLDKYFSDMNVDIIAEHGIWAKNKGKSWNILQKVNKEWKEEIRPILQSFVDRTPGALLEEKDYSLVWHYRNVNPSLVPVRVNELKNHIENLTHNLDIGMLAGNRVIEIKNTGINKGSGIQKMYALEDYDFIFSIGDDVTDEDMFDAMPAFAYSVRVGFQRSHAKYFIHKVSEVRKLLYKFID